MVGRLEMGNEKIKELSGLVKEGMIFSKRSSYPYDKHYKKYLHISPIIIYQSMKCQRKR